MKTLKRILIIAMFLFLGIIIFELGILYANASFSKKNGQLVPKLPQTTQTMADKYKRQMVDFITYAINNKSHKELKLYNRNEGVLTEFKYFAEDRTTTVDYKKQLQYVYRLSIKLEDENGAKSHQYYSAKDIKKTKFFILDNNNGPKESSPSSFMAGDHVIIEKTFDLKIKDTLDNLVSLTITKIDK